MAQKIITHTILTDDLTGKELPEGEGATVRFGLGDEWYEIDVATPTAEKIRNSLGQYIEHARKVHVGRNPRTRGTGQRRSGSPATSPGETRAARAWLVEQGLLKADSRGRIPLEMWDKFHNRNAPAPEPKPAAEAKPAPAKAAAPAPEKKPAPAKPANAGAPAKDAPKVKGVASLLP